jgi:ribosomal protein S18 acetylase RimI-like enzyme
MKVELLNDDSKINGQFLAFVEQMCLIHNNFDVFESYKKISLQTVIYETCLDYHNYCPLKKGYPIVWILRDKNKNFQGFSIGLQPIKGITPFIPEHVDYCDDFYIGSLYVLPRFQNKGGGKLLLKTIMEYCKENKYNRIFLNVDKENQKSISYYIKQQFKLTNYNDKNKVYFMEIKIE